MRDYTGFRDAMRGAGIAPPDEILADGVLHRFSTNGKARDSAGWYVLHDHATASAGIFGDFRTGLTQTWHSNEFKSMSQADRDTLQKKIDDGKKAREAEKKAEQEKAAERALIMWEAASPCESHPYLTAKGVKPHGLRVGRWVKADQETGEVYLDVPDALLVPIRDGKKITSLQAIYPTKIGNRNKDFLRGGKLFGCYFAIGKPDSEPRNDRPIYITEGYATGATIHELTGCAVVVCFAANNLKAVAERVRTFFGQHNIVIAADNDAWTDGNPGLVAAHQAGKAARAHVVWPVFIGGTPDCEKPTDFNDLHAIAGPQECRKQLLGFMQDVEPEPEAPETEAQEPEATEPEPAKAEVETRPAKSRTIDTMTPLPDTTEKGKPLSTIENLAEVCRRLDVTIRYNVVSKDEEIIIPNGEFSMDNRANATLAWLASWCARFNMPTGNLSDYACFMADRNQHSPVINWITSKPWDGKSRIDDFFSTVKSEHEPLKYILMRRWMVGAVAAAFKPDGVSAQGVLVFQGGQNLGKTKWFKGLVPQSLGVIQDGVTLDPKDKDSVKQAVSNWLVELGEVDATFRKSDIAQLKSFLTRDKDVLRRAYARKESTYPRRTVFFASVNPDYFLNDPTGNKRYWTIKCTEINHSHNIDMQQVWAEFYEIYKAGESWYLTPDELDELNETNSQHETLDPVTERIQSKLHWDDPTTLWIWSSVTDVLLRCGFDRPTKGDVTNAGIFLKKNPLVETKRTSSGRMVLAPKEKIRGEG
jgi:putative DNA primase/helicase